jgi:hypothetical protein
MSLNERMSQQNNGGASGAPLREKVMFQTNLPQAVTLEFDPPTQARDGRFGDQFMYFLGDNRIMWADPPLHEEIKRSGAKAGSEIGICKRALRNAGRRHIQWEVAVEEEPQQPPPVPRPPASAPAARPTRSAPRETAPPPIREGRERVSGNLMAAALREAIEACDLAEFDARPEDIRALAITIYINTIGGKK